MGDFLSIVKQGGTTVVSAPGDAEVQQPNNQDDIMAEEDHGADAFGGATLTDTAKASADTGTNYPGFSMDDIEQEEEEEGEEQGEPGEMLVDAAHLVSHHSTSCSCC